MLLSAFRLDSWELLVELVPKPPSSNFPGLLCPILDIAAAQTRFLAGEEKEGEEGTEGSSVLFLWLLRWFFDVDNLLLLYLLPFPFPS